jgi:hypothetical protein
MLLLFAVGCSESAVERIVYEDPAVVFDQEDYDQAAQGDPGITLGIYEEQLFRELTAGDDVPVIHGSQGGTWVHLSIRVTGLPADGLIAASLGDVGSIRYGLKLTRSPDGFLEAFDIPVPVRVSEDELDALFGTQLTLTVSFKVDDITVEASMPVTLAEG